jgi:hypothetical protein
VFIKPIVYYTVLQFFTILNKMRNLCIQKLETTKDRSTDRFVSNVNRNVNYRLNILFQTMTERVTSHDLRRLYGYLAFRKYADRALIQESEYLVEILGQDVKNSFATLCYSIVEVI